jgi:hypothetical protein
MQLLFAKTVQFMRGLSPDVTKSVLRSRPGYFTDFFVKRRVARPDTLRTRDYCSLKPQNMVPQKRYLSAVRELYMDMIFVCAVLTVSSAYPASSGNIMARLRRLKSDPRLSKLPGRAAVAVRYKALVNH